MADERTSATTIIDASAEVIFDVLADPAQHAAIDGTGWVVAPVDSDPLTETGQVFWMSMYHPEHPDGGYRTANEIQVFERPTAICWKPGYDAGGGTLGFGGWWWRYDLTPTDPGHTEVTLSYDWSAVPDSVREYLSFPPFPSDHLGNSLAHLAELVSERAVSR